MTEPEVYPDTKIITLLESNAEPVGSNYPNGTFDIQLDQQVTLKEGDTIELNKVFIDTTPSEETFITITEEESEITIKHGMYLTDMLPNDSIPGTPATPAKPQWGNFSLPVGQRPDGKRYILQNEEPAFANTQLEWTQTNNPNLVATPPNVTPGPGTITSFKTELSPLVPEDNNGFEYIVNPVPAGPPPADPVQVGMVLTAPFYISGHCRLIPTYSDSKFIGPYEFYYYSRHYVQATPGQFGANDHTAVFSRWTDASGKILGWKAKANPDTTETNPIRQWNFMSDADGYNYLDTGGLPHMIQINTIAMAINQAWSVVLSGAAIDVYYPTHPGYMIEWRDPRTNKVHQFNKRFDAPAYNAVINTSSNPPSVEKDGMDVLLKELPKSAIIPYDDRASLGLPTDKSQDWGRDSPWDFYRLSQFEDPFAVDSLPTLPTMICSIDHLPSVQFSFFSPPNPKQEGLPSGFINKKASWYDAATQSMTINSAQILSQTPVNNASTGGRTLIPREYTTTFSIAPGQYANGDLAQILTDKINQNSSPVVGLSNNPGAEQPVINAAGYSSSYFFQTSYELMEQADGYSQAAGLPNNLTRYPNDFAYSATAIGARTLADGTTLGAIAPATLTDLGVQPYFLAEDASALFQFKASEVQPLGTQANKKARNVGASEISVLFDETEQAFTIAQAHTSIVGGDNATPIDSVIQLVRALPDNSLSFFGEQRACDTYSGVFFTALEPQSLWFSKMGLSKNLLVSLGTGAHVIKDFSTSVDSSFNGLPTAPDLQSVMCHPTSLTKGVNVTGLFNGVDNLVVKKPAPAAPNPADERADDFATQPQVYSEAVATNTLVSLVGKSQVNAVEDDPYFQIEIAGINTQNIVGQPTKNSLVQGIVGKYFSNGNFTQDEDSGYAYTHKGEPIIIRQLSVRILDSKGQPENGLGPNSAVILKLSTDK